MLQFDSAAVAAVGAAATVSDDRTTVLSLAVSTVDGMLMSTS